MLDTLTATATAPAAFALSEQYKTQDDESETASNMEDGKAPQRKKGKAPKKKKKQQKRILVRLNCLKKRPDKGAKAGCGFDAPGPASQLKKAEPEAVEAPKSGNYSPHLYAQKRLIFIEASGLAFKEASAAWNASSERAALLSTVPLAELKRRKFVPRGCQEHPFR